MILRNLLKVIEEIRKDLAYTQRLEERWVKEKKRFPVIYESIVKQREFFEQVVEKALLVEVDESKLDEYMRNRPRLKVRRMKTAQVSPPTAEQIRNAAASMPKTEPVAPAPKTEPVAPAPEVETPASVAEPGAAPPAPPESETPEPSDDEKAKTAVAAVDEIVAEAEREVGDKSEEADTRELTLEAPADKEAKPAGSAKKAPGKSAKGTKAKSRENLKKLAGDVLDEVKKISRE